jgi:hypothetical protein
MNMAIIYTKRYDLFEKLAVLRSNIPNNSVYQDKRFIGVPPTF